MFVLMNCVGLTIQNKILKYEGFSLGGMICKCLVQPMVVWWKPGDSRCDLFWENEVTLYQGYISDLQRLRGYKKVPLSITWWLTIWFRLFSFEMMFPQTQEVKKRSKMPYF